MMTKSLDLNSGNFSVPVKISADTRLMGVIGQNISHSLSPAIHNFSAQDLGINVAYVVLDVPQANVRYLLSSLWEVGALGFSVTSPHKETVARLTNNHSLRAVNTVVRDHYGWSAASTDAEGLSQAIQHLGFDFKGFTRVLILGNGGVTQSILHHISQSFEVCPEVVVFRRDPGRDELLKSVVSKELSLRFEEFDVVSLSRETQGRSGETILIQATNAPLLGESLGALSPALDQYHGVFVDLVYGTTSALLEAAKRLKIPYQDGMPMLIEQARLAQKLWWGKAVSYERIHQFLGKL